MRAAEASQFSKNFDDDDALLKPQWLQRPSGAGIANQFRSAGKRITIHTKHPHTRALG
jgi:hypothetical protein